MKSRMTVVPVKQLSAALALLLVTLTAPAAHATNSGPELQGVLRDLLAWWPGEYDTQPQVQLERSLGAPPDGEHDRQYREFTRVDVPHLGQNVIYGEVRSGGPDGALIKGQQVMYIITIDSVRQVVNVTGRRIKGGPEFERVYRDPEKLRRVELDPAYGGNCDFRFRRYGPVLRGVLANSGGDNRACTMVSRNSGQTMTWDADWMIGPDELWVFDNGYLLDPARPTQPGRLFSGREDMTHERLYRIRRFSCRSEAPGPAAGTARAAGSAAPVLGDRVSDRGGEFVVSLPTQPGLRARLQRAPLPTGSPAVLEDALSLELLAADGARVLAATREPGTARSIAVDFQQTRLRCELPR